MCVARGTPALPPHGEDPLWSRVRFRITSPGRRPPPRPRRGDHASKLGPGPTAATRSRKESERRKRAVELENRVSRREKMVLSDVTNRRVEASARKLGRPTAAGRLSTLPEAGQLAAETELSQSCAETREVEPVTATVEPDADPDSSSSVTTAENAAAVEQDSENEVNQLAVPPEPTKLVIPPEQLATAQRLLERVKANRSRRQQRAGGHTSMGEVATHAAADALEDALARARERGFDSADARALLSDAMSPGPPSTTRKWRLGSLPRSERSKRGETANGAYPARTPARLMPAGAVTYEQYVAGPGQVTTHEVTDPHSSSSCLLDFSQLGQYLEDFWRGV